MAETPAEDRRRELAVLMAETGSEHQDLIDRDILDRGMIAAEAATEMALSGTPYTEIARVCGYYSATTARHAVMRVIAAAHDADEDYRSMRRVESQRLMGLLRSVWDRATDTADPDHLAYNRQAAAIVAQHARLHGLDAPQAIQFVTPGQDVFENVVARTAAALNAGVPDEADIFEIAENEETRATA